MGFYPVTDAFESCRGSYPAMGKEEFFCPVMGYRFNSWPEGIKALVDLSYGIGAKTLLRIMNSCVRFFLLMITATLGGSEGTWMTVFTICPLIFSPSFEVTI